MTEPKQLIEHDIAILAIQLVDLWDSESPTDLQIDSVRLQLTEKVKNWREAE